MRSLCRPSTLTQIRLYSQTILPPRAVVVSFLSHPSSHTSLKPSCRLVRSLCPNRFNPGFDVSQTILPPRAVVVSFPTVADRQRFAQTILPPRAVVVSAAESQCLNPVLKPSCRLVRSLCLTILAADTVCTAQTILPPRAVVVSICR